MSSEVASFDIIHNILSRLPAKTLLRLRYVCKAWKSIIDDPFFAKYHTKNQHSSSTILIARNRYGGALLCLSLDSLNYDGRHHKLEVIPLKQIIHDGSVPRLSELPAPSCNGLILISHKNIDKSWAICNPLLRDFHLLLPPPPLPLPVPETDLKGGYGYVLATCGLGYDEGSDDYKVVRVDKFHGKKVNDYYYYTTRVYSMKSRFWRTIDFPGGDCLGHCGVFLDGALHWRSPDGMVVLDLGREVHRSVAGPPTPSEGRRCWESLDALDGCLIWSYGHENFKGVVEAWVMEDYGTEKSWTKLFSVETACASCLRIVGYLKSKGQVFVHHSYGDGGLRWFDLEKKCWGNIIEISGILYSLFELSFAQFSPGLVRLDNHKNTRGR